MPRGLRDIPESPTLRDLYQLVATTSQQVTNHGEELCQLRTELTRLISHQADDIRAHRADIDRLDARLGELRIQVEAIKAWQMAHQYTCPFVGNGRELARAQIAQLMRSHFSEEELSGLAYPLGIDMENVAARTHDERVRQLIATAERHQRLKDLLAQCQRERPFIAWPLAYE